MTNPVHAFLSHVAKNELSIALNFVAEDAVFSPQGPRALPIYGSFEGKVGAERLFLTLSEIFQTEAFEVREWAQTEGMVFAWGYMRHRVRRTNRTFESEFALVVSVSQGLIRHWRIYEDTAAFEVAYV